MLMMSLSVIALSFTACLKEKSETIAKVGSAVISEADLTARIQTFPPESQAFFQNEANKDRLLQQLIDEETLLQFAKKQKIHQKDTVKEQLDETREQAKRQSELLERRVILAAFVEESIDKKVDISEEDVKAYFESNRAQYGPVEERSLSHILVSDEGLAKQLRARIKKGASFEKIAKISSLDSTKTNGGDLGWVTADQLVPEFSKVAFAMTQKNQISGVVKSPFGFHIIKFKAAKKRPAQTFDDVKETIYNTLYTTERESLFSEILKEAKETIKVTKEAKREAVDSAAAAKEKTPQS